MVLSVSKKPNPEAVQNPDLSKQTFSALLIYKNNYAVYTIRIDNPKQTTVKNKYILNL